MSSVFVPQKLAVRFETLGCKLNQIESESAARAFSDCGFDCRMEGISASSLPDSDTLLCIVNTCTVTAKAEQKCRRIVRLLLEKCPRAVVLITGCYAQLDGKILLAMGERIAVLGGKNKDALVTLPSFLLSFMRRYKGGPSPACSFSLAFAAELRSLYAGSFAGTFCKTERRESGVRTTDAFTLSTDTFLQHSRPSLKIQDGCDNRCSYCRICFARGSSMSLEQDKVLARVLQLERLGHREVVLTGVNLSQYGFDGLSCLLDLLLRHTSSISFRLSSLHPQSIDKNLCAVLAHERVRAHFHLSVQSGSDAVLCAMKRPYNAECVCNAVENLRRIKRLPFIACDIIVGFPGETPEDFNKTLELCRSCKFSWIHTFPFSPRPGTAAYKMKNTVAPSHVRSRVQKLNALAELQKTEYIESCIGEKFKAIVEKFRTGEIRAVTENFLHVQIKKTLCSKVSDPADFKLKATGGAEVLLCIDSVHKTGLRGEDCEAFAFFA